MTDFSKWEIEDDFDERSGYLFMKISVPGGKSPVPMRLDFADRIRHWEAGTLAEELCEASGVFVSDATAEALLTRGSDGLTPLQRMADQAERRFQIRQEIYRKYGHLVEATS